MMILMLCVGVVVIIGPTLGNQNTDEITLNEQTVPLDGFETEEESELSYDLKPNFRVVREMGVGWNLGGSLESVNFEKLGINTTLYTRSAEDVYETLWGSPITTEEVMKTVKAAGFNAVRIPVSYYDHFDENYVITDTWLDRVEEVVGYAIKNDLYCIINLHHEEPWLKANMATVETDKANLSKVWSQIADRFKSYDERLLFESFNEVLSIDKNWTSTNVSDYRAINILNQTFVDTIRASSGYNKERFLIVPTYGASNRQEPIDGFELPIDTIDDHLIVEVHSYAPSEFTWTEREITWKETYSDWDDTRDGGQIIEILERLDKRFIQEGIPVIIGEMSAYNKNNTPDRVAYSNFIVSEAKARRIACFWWDGGGKYADSASIRTGTLLDRQNYEWYFREVVDALVDASK